jgi:alkanesulfonate monooxygenase SsuD/methylene tetrahydromethanopterin reductase-like flavin-dependent oxidoreductase (luciferase family)
VRFAVGCPNVREYGDVRVAVELGRRAEAAGWDGFFVWDHIAYRERGAAVADPWVAIAALAAITKRVRLGVMVCALARRRPWKVARETASLDLLSGGRMVFGAGLGSMAEEEFAAFGEEGDAAVRASRLDEGLEILASLWRGDDVDHRGEHYEVRTGSFLPAPVQRPRIPVWIAGRWPARPPFRRAARWDGVFPTHRDVGHDETMSPEQVAEIVAFTRSQRDSGEPFDVVIEGRSDGGHPARDLEMVSRYRAVGVTWWIEKLGWFRGSIDEMRRRIDAGPPREVR